MKVCKICLEPCFSKLQLIRHIRIEHQSDKKRNYAERKKKEALSSLKQEEIQVVDNGF